MVGDSRDTEIGVGLEAASCCACLDSVDQMSELLDDADLLATDVSWRLDSLIEAGDPDQLLDRADEIADRLVEHRGAIGTMDAEALATVMSELAELGDVADLDKLETAPIASVHLWYDQSLTELPHATFVDRLSQWMFNRTVLTDSPNAAKSGDQSGLKEDGEGCRLQVVISAAHDLSSMSEQEVIAKVDSELREVWPENREARLLKGRMITEHRAVFSPLPGVDEIRPVQQSPISNLQFAGDWTRTGWPATMEGAVRSGYLAAENVLRSGGLSDLFLPADLSPARLYQWLFS